MSHNTKDPNVEEIRRSKEYSGDCVTVAAAVGGGVASNEGHGTTREAGLEASEALEWKRMYF